MAENINIIPVVPTVNFQSLDDTIIGWRIQSGAFRFYEGAKSWNLYIDNS